MNSGGNITEQYGGNERLDSLEIAGRYKYNRLWHQDLINTVDYATKMLSFFYFSIISVITRDFEQLFKMLFYLNNY